MEWRPHGAIEVLADDYRLIRYPDWALDPVFPAAHVTRSRTGRPADEVIDEVAARVRRWGLHGVAWWVSSATRPLDTEKALCARGGKQIDAVQILARELSDGLPDLDVPADVKVELVADERTFRAASMVTVRGWGRREPTGAALAREFTEAIQNLATWSSFRVVAMIGQEPASSGGCTLRGEVAQAVGRGHPAGVPAARQLPGGAGRTAAAGPRTRRGAGPGERPHRDLRADPAPGRLRRLRAGALLLALNHQESASPAGLCTGCGHAVMHA